MSLEFRVFIVEKKITGKKKKKKSLNKSLFSKVKNLDLGGNMILFFQ